MPEKCPLSAYLKFSPNLEEMYSLDIEKRIIFKRTQQGSHGRSCLYLMTDVFCSSKAFTVELQTQSRINGTGQGLFSLNSNGWRKVCTTNPNYVVGKLRRQSGLQRRHPLHSTSNTGELLLEGYGMNRTRNRGAKSVRRNRVCGMLELVEEEKYLAIGSSSPGSSRVRRLSDESSRGRRW